MTTEKPKIKSQSAIEYLTTYGWAIVTISVVLGALYQLGFFSGTNFITNECLSQAGFTCQQPVMNTTGYLQVSFGQLSNGTITLTGTGCSNNTAQPTIQTNFVLNGSTSITLSPGQKYSVVFQCPGVVTGGKVGAPFRGYLWIKYNSGTQTGLIGQVATVSTLASTQASFLGPPYIYCIGSSSGSGQQTYYAALSSTGIGSWAASTAIPTPGGFLNSACGYYNGYVYCVGSQAGGGTTTYLAPLSGGAGIGSWTAGTALPSPYTGLAFGPCSAYKGYIYCAWPSGGTGNAVISAAISSTGIGTWTSVANVPGTASGQSTDPCLIYQGTLICMTSSTYYATVSGGTVGGWTTEAASASYPASIYAISCVTYNGYIYCVSGHNSGALTYYAPISTTGIGSWTSSTAYPVSNYQTSCVTISGNIYCAGTYSGSTSYYAQLSSTGIGSWTSTTAFPISDDAHACVTTTSGGSYTGGGAPSS